MEFEEKVSGPGGASQKNWTHLNTTDEMPLEMQFNHGHMVSIIVYSVLMVISATGNLTVLSQLVKRRRMSRASRLDVLLMHLAVADLMVSLQRKLLRSQDVRTTVQCCYDDIGY